MRVVCDLAGGLNLRNGTVLVYGVNDVADDVWGEWVGRYADTHLVTARVVYALPPEPEPAELPQEDKPPATPPAETETVAADPAADPPPEPEHPAEPPAQPEETAHE